MPSPSSGGRRKKPAAALPPPAPASSMAERDWATLPGDILFAIFLKLGPREIMEGSDRACSAWRRVSVGEPKLWRCVDMGTVRQWSSTTKPWRAIARVAVGRAAGQCEHFSGPWDDDFLLYLAARYVSIRASSFTHSLP
ncbi:putative F-box/LRR-repeat protein 23 [Panicum miliaceum]|uniref:F-box/LRR-repeat protein 23 n=1 Tax=Panicum miliaceum TaxID=4540 RepID=A0A3L6PNS0_PANMI|nr:putative F-box/LRR-repeat protein 23 [Panicum miliaceum]